MDSHYPSCNLFSRDVDALTRVADLTLHASRDFAPLYYSTLDDCELFLSVRSGGVGAVDLGSMRMEHSYEQDGRILDLRCR
jgi:hypothetical protein